MNTSYRSPNYNVRLEGSVPLFLIMHYTECGLEEALRALTDAQTARPVSAHYVIDEQGIVYQLVDEEHCAWHAGVSQWKDKSALNTWSIGIELIHPGHSPQGLRQQPYPLPQMESLAYLSRSIIQRYSILPKHVLGHSDIAPQRKRDPGEFFNWAWLAQQGVGFWPQEEEAPSANIFPFSVKGMQQMLKEFGYAVPVHGTLDRETQNVIRAFQRHFCPQQLTGQLGRLSFKCAESILRQT